MLQAKLIFLLIGFLGVLGAGTAVFMKGKAYCENKVNEARIEAQEAAAQKRDKLTSKHLKTVSRLRNEVETLTQEISKNVPDNPACDVTGDTIGLLDTLRGVPQASGVDAGADAEFRAYLSQRDAFRQWGKDAEAYRLCQERVAAFIEWHGD